MSKSKERAKSLVKELMKRMKLFCAYEYFDRVNSAKCKLKKSNDEKDEVENEC